MTTLRLRQKRKREQGILDAAEKLFMSKGYLNTSIEEIAEKAEVGVGTVYNYFHSKSNLLIALFRLYHLQLKEDGNAILNNPPDDAIEAICDLLQVYYDGAMSYFPKEYLRELVGVLTNERFSIQKESMKLDHLIIDQIADLVRIFQERKKIRRDVSPQDVSMLIYSTFDTAGLFFIYDEKATVESSMAFIKSNLQLIYNGLKPG